MSFRKGFHKDIVPATISSWIKQTVLLCYQLSDQSAQDLHQVRAHDVRAFAASQAFQGGISLDQILSACHWKAHNTFTQFYLRDLAWADSGCIIWAPWWQPNKFRGANESCSCFFVHSVYSVYIKKKKKEKPSTICNSWSAMIQRGSKSEAR